MLLLLLSQDFDSLVNNCFTRYKYLQERQNFNSRQQLLRKVHILTRKTRLPQSRQQLFHKVQILTRKTKEKEQRRGQTVSPVNTFSLFGSAWALMDKFTLSHTDILR